MALYAGWQNWINWFIHTEIAVIKFNNGHFWNRHLACYVTPATNDQVDQAITNDFSVNHWQKTGDPAVGTNAQFVFSFNANAQTYPITYRIFHYGNLTQGAYTYDTYIVGTAFIRGKPNCPGY